MAQVNLYDKIMMSYYKAVGGDFTKRLGMYLDIDKFDDSNESGLEVDSKLVDYKNSSDLEIKEFIHENIFHGDYNCNKYIGKLACSKGMKTGLGLFFQKFNPDNSVGNMVCKDDYIGAMDFINYGSRLVMCNFGIVDSYRGNGYSNSCLLLGVKNLKSIGINKVFLFVRRDNLHAIKIYKKFGFEEF